MIELRLVGYTADLEHLVLEVVDDRADGGGGYRLVVEPDLFATLDDVRRQRREAGLPVGDVVEFAERFGLDREALREAAPSGHVGGDGDPTAGGSPAQDDHEASTGPDPPAGGAGAGSGSGPSPFAPPRDDTGGGGTPGTDDATGEPAAGQAPAGEPDAGTDPAGGERAREPAPDDGEPPTAAESVIPTVRLLDGNAEDADDGDADLDRVLGAVLSEQSSQDGDRRPGGEQAEPDGDTGGEQGAATGAGAGDGRDAGEAAGSSDDEAGAGAPTTTGQAHPDADGQARDGDPPHSRPDSKLSPAEIQAELRAGRSARAVAHEAEADLAWIQRWLTPIEAERSRVLEEARRLHLSRPRLGTSGDPLGAAVRHNLSKPTVEDGSLDWSVARRSNGRWRVRVSYTQRGRDKQATWTYDPEEGELRAASPKARRLGFTRLQE